MHDLKFLRQNRDKVETGIALKGMAVDLDRFYTIEERRLAVLHETEQLKARRNAASEEIARRKRAGEDAQDEITAMREVGDRIKGLDAELRQQLACRLFRGPVRNAMNVNWSEADVLHRRHVLEQAMKLKHEPDAAAQPMQHCAIRRPAVARS